MKPTADSLPEAESDQQSAGEGMETRKRKGFPWRLLVFGAILIAATSLWRWDLTREEDEMIRRGFEYCHNCGGFHAPPGVWRPDP